MRKLIVFGATSKIGHEIMRLAAQEKVALLLVARNEERLQTLANDLRARGSGSVETLCLDLADISQHEALFLELDRLAPDFDAALLVYGTLGDQTKAEASVEETLTQLNTNFVSYVSLLNHLAQRLERRKGGLLAVITSVAGDRGRRSNYVYGSAKGALTLYCQGLRARLFRSGVRVLTIKPGPVETPMTAGMKMPLMAKPDAVAKTIYKSMQSGRQDVLYVPGIWRPIMFAIRALPESIAKKLSL